MHSRLDKLRNQKPSENRAELGSLIDRFMLDEVEAVFEDWRFHKMRLHGEWVIGPRHPRS